MAERYAISAGNWVAARFDGGTLPGVGDTVHANGFAVTIDTSITVDALSTRPGTTAVAGGSFTTSGTVTVNADSYAGTTSCLALTASSGSIQNGNSYGSNTTNAARGTFVNAGCVQNGDATGGNGSNRSGSSLSTGTLNGDSYGGTGTADSFGVVLLVASVQNGDSYGNRGTGTSIGSDSTQNGNAYGGSAIGNASSATAGGVLNGDSYGGTVANARGAAINDGGRQVGDSYGGSAANAHGTDANSGGVQVGKQFGGTNATAFGTGIAVRALVITQGITDGTAPALIARNNDSVVFLQNGTTSGQVTIASGVLRTRILDADFAAAASGGFPLSRVLN
jgi:hypothetical protein